MHEQLSTHPVSPTLGNPLSASARELHEILVRTHAVGNQLRRHFSDALRALHDSRLYLQLGFPNVDAYAEATFRFHHTKTYQLIEVSRALLALPGIARAFESGEISWSLASKLCGVATAETEGEWLEFLRHKRIGAVLLEIRDAKEKERRKPRKDGFGLPGLPVRVALELRPEEHALYEKGIARVRSELAPSLGGESLEPKDVLLLLLRRVLETGPAESVIAGRHETGISPFTVVVHKCEACARGAVQTDAGRVELEPKALARIEREAERVVPEEIVPRSRSPVSEDERDRPNSPALRQAVMARDGLCCANPCCRRRVDRDGHVHHIEARALGGRTEMRNTCLLCVWCHALVHSGHLHIEGDPERGLVFRPAAAGLTAAIRKSLEAGRAVPVIRTVEVATVNSASAESAVAESTATQRQAQAVLEKLGCSRKESRRRLGIAVGRSRETKSGRESLSVEELVLESLRL